jgi:hypothetical protein
MFVTQAELDSSIKMLKNYEETGVIPNNDPETLWRAKQGNVLFVTITQQFDYLKLTRCYWGYNLLGVEYKYIVKDASLHPDTGEKIPLLLRASSFVPINVTIAAGMLLPGAGVRKNKPFPSFARLP